MVHNGFGLGEGGELEVQMFNLAQMFIRIPYLKFCTKTPTFAKPLLCLVLSSYLSSLLNTMSSTKTGLEPSTGITDMYDIATL